MNNRKGQVCGAYPGGNLLPKKPKQRESFEEFCKRLGIKHNTKQGGVEFSPYHGGNLLHKKPKQGPNLLKP